MVLFVLDSYLMIQFRNLFSENKKGKFPFNFEIIASVWPQLYKFIGTIFKGL